MIIGKTLTNCLTIRMAVLLLCAVTVSPLFAKDKQVIGWVKNVAISNRDIILPGKIDTGAKHSSLYAPDLHLFNKDGESWV